MSACRFLVALGCVAALLLASGCGCTDDTVCEIAPLNAANAQVGVEIVPVPVRIDPGPVKVDVMFLLDDSFFITDDVFLGRILNPLPGGGFDGRVKTEVAQEVFADVVADLLDQLVSVDGLGVAEDFDLAFGVSRFEDYANFVRSVPRLVPDLTDTAEPVDSLARPFVLNQPLLRWGTAGSDVRVRFDSEFFNALAREAPGNGGQNPFDGQSALEALYQLARGTGFDGNGNASTEDSGAAGLDTTQTAPGDSGDVPAPDFGAGAEDEDGEPLYTLGDTFASGNLGGAGWRPDSIRFVITFSNLCTIAPLRAGTYDTDAEGRIIGTISNTPSAAGEGPRGPATISNLQAFACTDGLSNLDDYLPVDPQANDPQTQQAYGRYGVEDGAVPVAPYVPGDPLASAATLQDVIEALNELDIEVLSIGIREQIDPGPVKPNLPEPAEFPEEPAVTNPVGPPESKAPFNYMSALAILTDARDTDLTDPDERWTPNLPLVYNLVTVNPWPGGDPTNDVVEDLSDRIAEWLEFKETGEVDPGSVDYEVTISIENENPALVFAPPPFPLVPETAPDETYVAQNGLTQTVRVPRYIEGEPAPPNVRVAWQFGVTRVNPDDRAAQSSSMPFVITANVLGPPPPDIADLLVDPVGGEILVELEAVPEDAPATPPGRATLFELLEPSGPAFFRDVERGIPAGTDLGSMAGPLFSSDLPFP